MKGIQGLLIAGLLGLLGIALNWVYLQQKAKNLITVSFVGIKQGEEINPGDIIREDQLAPVTVPVTAVGEDLKNFAYPWQAKKTVAGIRAIRKYEGGHLIFRDDYRTPPPELKLEDRQLLIWIPVDGKNFVPELVNPGDQISFLVPRFAANAPTPARPGELPGAGEGAALDATDMIGPFTVGSLGNRLGTREVMQGARQVSSNERQVGIVVNKDGTKLEPRAMHLLERLRQVNFTNIGVALHPKTSRG